MKTIIKENSTYVFRFDQGDDVIVLLTNYCAENNITAAHFSGIGSAQEAILAYYKLQTKHFEDHAIQENLEIVSLTGNIALLDGKPIVHAHGVLSKKDLSTIGGHIKKLVVSATAEIVLTKLEGTLTRHHDETTGLNLLH